MKRLCVAGMACFAILVEGMGAEIDDIRRRADTHGLHNHPNDLGMELIARRFLKAIK